MEKDLSDENLPEEQHVGTLTWSRLITAGILLGCIAMHAKGFELALPMLSIFVGIFFFKDMFHQIQLVRGTFGVAVAITMGDQHIIHHAAMDNPHSGGMTTLFFVNMIVAYYLYNQGVILPAVAAILPNISMFTVYSRLMAFVSSDPVKKYAAEQMKCEAEENRRLQIFQEEIDKVLPQVEAAVNERLEKIFGNQEETINESRESDDPDQ